MKNFISIQIISAVPTTAREIPPPRRTVRRLLKVLSLLIVREPGTQYAIEQIHASC